MSYLEATTPLQRTQECEWHPVLGAILNGRPLIPDEKITCLYDMDIVFQSNGNFDEVYLYVSDRLTFTSVNDKHYPSML